MLQIIIALNAVSPVVLKHRLVISSRHCDFRDAMAQVTAALRQSRGWPEQVRPRRSPQIGGRYQLADHVVISLSSCGKRRPWRGRRRSGIRRVE
jgi:hypothetical protein